jgi:hypothetical protein
MKKTIITLIYLTYTISGIGQVCSDCYEDNGISTNPNAPENCQIELRWPTSSFTNQFKNTFDWAKNSNDQFHTIKLNDKAGWQVPHLTDGPFDMFSPFTQDYLEDNSSSVDEHDWHWEDGWELMWMNTGYYPNGDEYHDHTLNINPIVEYTNLPHHRQIPYIILYNRYTGKMRAFFNVFAELGTYQHIQLVVKYKDKTKDVSGILRHLANYDIPLDRKTEVLEINTQFLNGNNINRWFIAEFQLGFDPCVCDYFSELTFELFGLSSFDVSLTGRSISADLELKDNNGKPIYDDFLNMNSVKTSQNSGSGGAFIYKSLDSLLAGYDKNLEQYQQDINDFDDPGSKAKSALIGTVKTALNYAMGVPIPEEFLGQLGKTVAGIVSPNANDETIKKNGKFYSKELSKATKATLGSLSDQLFTEFYIKPTKPVKPSMPTATFTEMSISGIISRQDKIEVNELWTPGSFQVQPQGLPQVPAFNPNSYPIYNKPVGLFALLETPEVSVLNLNEQKNHVIYSADCEGQNESNYEDTEIFRIHEKNIFFKLKNPIKYRTNHSVDFDFDRTKIYGQLTIEYERNGNYATGLSNVNNYSIIYVSHTTNLIDSRSEITEGVETKLYESDFYPLEDFGEVFFQITHSDSTYIAYNPCLPAPSGIGFEIKIKKIKLKVMADMYFESPGFDGYEKNSTQVFTYLLYDKDENVDFIESHGEWLDETQISQIKKYELGTLKLENEVIEPTDDFVHETIGNVIYVNAENIELKGNISVAAGYEAKLQAYWDIEVLPNAEIFPGIELVIKRDFYNFPETEEVSNAELAAFCKGSSKKYQANVAKNKTELWVDEDKIEDKIETPKAIEFSVRPNPTYNSVTLNWNFEESANQVVVMNMFGQQIINEPIYSGEHSKTIDLSNHTKGVYFVIIYSESGKKGQQKLIKL